MAASDHEIFLSMSRQIMCDCLMLAFSNEFFLNIDKIKD